MKFQSFSLKLIAFGGLALLLAACTRPQNELSSQVTFRAPSAKALSQNSAMAALPVGKKACYGVNVTGPGIASTFSGDCGVNLGIPGGFVAEGQSMVVYVPKGESRTFSVMMALVDANESCPTLDSGFLSSPTNIHKSYFAGSTSGVNLVNDEETVSIAVSFPGETQTIAANATAGSCKSLSGLKASLYANGDVLDASGALLANYSSPDNEGLYFTGINDVLGIGIISSGGVLNLVSASAANLPPEIYSVTRKPDTGKYYGLFHDGKIVEVLISGASASYAPIAAGSCPFSVPNCTVPVWMQSISAGYGLDLFSLDHAGNIYKLSATGPTDTGVNVSPAITQVSYY